MDNDFLQLSKKIHAEKIKAGGIKEEVADKLPFEIFLIVYLNERHILTLSCSPIDLVELAIGCLVNNGYVKDYAGIELMRLCSQERSGDRISQIIYVSASTLSISQDDLNTAKYLSSACGDIDDLIFKRSLEKVKSDHRFDASSILQLNKITLSAQKHKKECGGLHSASLFDDEATILNTSEDIGRHNCIDKIAGFMLKNKIIPDDKVLFSTGRISMDVIYKVSRMDIPVLVSNSSVTYSAAKAAEKLGITVIGYARGERFNIYSCPGRIVN